MTETASPRAGRSLIITYASFAVLSLHLFAQRMPIEKHATSLGDLLSFAAPSSLQNSPDGERVAFVATRPSVNRNRDKATLAVISSGDVTSFRINNVQWMPDQRQLTYVAEASGRNRIWLANVTGRDRRALTDGSKMLAQVSEERELDSCSPRDLSVNARSIAQAVYDTVATRRKVVGNARGCADSDPSKRGQYSRWRAMRPSRTPPAERDARPPVTARDLVTLRDITYNSVGISPDGRHVAFQVHRADPDRNTYQSAWYVVAANGTTPPVKVADGGEPLFGTSGDVIASVPVWAPEGSSFVYARKDSCATQLWVARVDGTPARQLTHSAGDIEFTEFTNRGRLNIVWTSDGASIIFSTGMARRTATDSAVTARRHGYFFDSTTLALHWDDNITPGNFATKEHHVQTYDLAAGTERPAAPTEVEELRAAYVPAVTGTDIIRTIQAVLSPDGRWVAYNAAVAVSDPAIDHYCCALYVKRMDAPGPGTLVVPGDSLMLGNFEILWTPDSQGLYYHRIVPKEGRLALFHLDRTGGTSKRVDHVLPGDYIKLFSLERAGRLAAGIVSGPSTPEEVAVVDLRTGILRRLTDLNPQWRSLDVQPATLITWTNRYGHLTYGHLFRPRGYVRGRRYPLVITTYDSHGFARGGVGDEYPVQPLVAEGFAVLSYNRLYDSRALRPNAVSFESSLRGWESPMASLEAVVNVLADSGLVDPQRAAVTGLSFGAEIVSFTISHSNTFASAISSGCSFRDPIAFWLSGDRASSYFGNWQLGPPDGPTADRWQRLSPALNAARVTAPLLVNAASSELACELQFYTSLKAHQKVVELYAYDDETHVKHQPAHRFEIYERNIDWLNFWLQGREDPDPGKRSQYQRWRALRALQNQETPLNTSGH